MFLFFIFSLRTVAHFMSFSLNQQIGTKCCLVYTQSIRYATQCIFTRTEQYYMSQAAASDTGMHLPAQSHLAFLSLIEVKYNMSWQLIAYV